MIFELTVMIDATETQLRRYPAISELTAYRQGIDLPRERARTHRIQYQSFDNRVGPGDNMEINDVILWIQS